MRHDRPLEFAVTIGMDALRIAIGIQPRNHDVETVCRWLRLMAGLSAPQGATNECD